MVDVHVRSGQLHLVAVWIAVAKILALCINIGFICIQCRVIADGSDRNRLFCVPERDRTIEFDLVDRPVRPVLVRLYR